MPWISDNVMRAGIVCLLCAAAMLWASASAHAAGLPLLSHHGRWLTDPQGRVAVLHGVQIDHYARGATVESIDLTPANVSFVAAQGFNLLRNSIAFAGVEPQLGQFDDNYVGQFVAFDHELAAAGIYDLIDMMQGQYGPRFQGAGFPDWMTYTDGAPNISGPFPQSYIYDPAEQRAWDNFWADHPAADGNGLQEHYAIGLRYLARALERQPAFLGFDLMNEPWPGSQYPTCANPEGCPVFDQSLNAFYRRIIPALRIDDPRHLVFYEPHALFDQGAATNIGPIGDPNAVFTFHTYCLGDQPGLPQADPGENCGINEQIVLSNAEAQAGRTGDGLLEDEWGNTPSVPLLQRMAAEADQHMIGWSYWAYEDCCNSPGRIVRDGAKAPTEPENLNVAVLKPLVRPYPKLIAGTPSSWSYDPASGEFKLSYSTHAVAGGTFAPGVDTQVELPALRYPTGYAVHVEGASVRSAPDANLLLLASEPGASGVKLTVTPARHHSPAPGPFSWPAGATTTVPADCPPAARKVIRIGGSARVVRVAVYVDGQHVTKKRAHRIRRIRLPAGLADGSSIQLFARTADGRLLKTSRDLRGCRPTPRQTWLIERPHTRR